MNIRKKILGYLTVIGLGFMAFAPSTFMGNSAYAVTPLEQADSAEANYNATKEKTVGVEEALNEFWSLVDLALKLMYIVIWPMLFLAGIALDNSMVYGSFFHMDAPLWFFWNMTKNFANFALGFMVLFAILKGIFTSFGDKGKDDRSPMNVIKKTLIAGVLIQASWFIMAALIDVSTIATYAIGGMPMSLLENKSSTTNAKILQTESHLELNNVTKLQEEDFRVWYKTKIDKDGAENMIEISPCLLRTLGTDTYIVGRKYGDPKFSAETINKNLPTDMLIKTDAFKTRNVCVFRNTPFFFNEFPNTIDITDDKTYTTTLKRNINELGSKNAKLLEDCMFIVNLEETKKQYTCKESLEKIKKDIDEQVKTNKEIQTSADIFKDFEMSAINSKDYGGEGGKLRFDGKGVLAPTVSEIISKTKGFVGPFVTIYASIMDFANLSDGNSDSSIGKNIGNMMIRAVVAIGLVFPLIALALVLFIRIGFLRLIIATSPLIILANVFGFKIDKLSDKISIDNILRAIFAPVITVFALSISMIFMTTLSNSLSTSNIDKIDVIGQLGGTIDEKSDDKENTHLTIGGFTIVYPKIVDTYAGATGDWFSWMLLSFCGIGIMWFILFAAIKASGTIGDVSTKIKDFGENMFKTAPIIPMGGGMSFESMKYATTIPDQLTQKRERQERANAKDYFESKRSILKDDGIDTEIGVNETRDLINLASTTSDRNQIATYLEKQKFISEGLNDEDKNKAVTTFLGSSATMNAISKELNGENFKGKNIKEIKENLKKIDIDIEKHETTMEDIKEINKVLDENLKGKEDIETINQILKDISPKGEALNMKRTINGKEYTITKEGGKAKATLTTPEKK